MSRSLVFSPEAVSHLTSIEAFIARAASPRIAAAFVDSIVQGCEALVLFPERGRRRDEILPGLRIVGFRRRVTIGFVVEAERVVVVGIAYRGRDIESVLRP